MADKTDSWAATGDLVDCLVALADASPDRVLFIELMDGTNESARLTAGSLVSQAAAVAGELTRRGIARDDVALLIATAPTEFLVAFVGCMWAGVIPAPIAFPRRPEHLLSRLEPVRANAGAVAVVAGTPNDDAERTVLDLLTGGTVPVIAITGAADDAPAPPVSDRDVAYLQYTSGSTSDPKGVIVTHDNLVANLEVTRHLLGYNPESVNVSWCPLTHDMGLILGALPSLAFGMLSVLMPPSAFIRRPLTWVRAIDRYRGTHGYSPNFGYDLCVDRSTDDDRAALDLSSMQTWINGAEPVRRHTGERFLEAFAVSKIRPESYTPAYGLAESTVFVSAAPSASSGTIVWVDAAALEADQVVLRNEGDDGVRQLCSDGVPGPGYDVRIVDPATSEVVDADRVGELWLRGPSVSPGYWRRPEATAETFGGTIPGDTGGPYLRTGDLAFMHAGEIVICGRAKDLIVIHGRNIHPQDVELTAELAHDAVRSGGSAAFAVDDEAGEALVVVAEVNGEPDQLEVATAIRTAVLKEFELRVSDVLLVPPQGVPKTSSGKKQRAATRELWHRARGAAPVGSA